MCSFKVSRKHILTAAHCFRYKDVPQAVDPSKCVFYLGKHDFAMEYEAEAIRKKFSRYIMHPDWDVHAHHWDADLAIAILESPVTYSRYFLPLCLNERSKNNFYGEFGTIIGWGLTNEYSEAEDQILELDVKIIDPQTCYSTDRKLKTYASDDESVICVGNRNNTGACIGESFINLESFLE